MYHGSYNEQKDEYLGEARSLAWSCSVAVLCSSAWEGKVWLLHAGWAHFRQEKSWMGEDSIPGASAFSSHGGGGGSMNWTAYSAKVHTGQSNKAENFKV